MNRALLAALLPLLLLPAKGNDGNTRPPVHWVWSGRNVPLCPSGRVPATPNVRLDQVRGGDFVEAGASPEGPTRENPGVCLGLARTR